MTKYTSFMYYLRGLSIPKLSQYFELKRINTKNMDILIDFLNGITNLSFSPFFEFIGIPSIVNIINLIKNNILYVYILQLRENIYGVYFIKDIFTNYENIENGNTLQLICSINNSTSPNLFSLGFMHIINRMLKNKEKKYQMILIDEISHNITIIKYWNKYFSSILNHQNAYYLYNFVYPKSPIIPEKCLFIL